MKIPELPPHALMAQARAVIRGQEPMPGMFDFVMRLSKRVFQSETRICKVFCERNGIEHPKEGTPITEQLKMLQGKVCLIRTTFQAGPTDLVEDAEFITQQSWCTDVREDPNNSAIAWPMVVVVRKGLAFSVNIHDPDGNPELYADLQGDI